MKTSNSETKKRILKRAELRRKLICDAATRLFAEHGYNSTTLEMIAEEVGYSKANFYTYFKNKEEVLAQLVVELNQEISRRVEQSVKPDLAPEVQLQLFSRILVNSLYDHPVNSAIIQTGRPFDFQFSYPEIVNAQRRITEITKNIIQKGIKENTFYVLDINVAALSFLYSLRSVLRWYSPEGYLSLEQIADQITNLFLRGLMNPDQKC